ncbi:hypothetical protein KCU99_g8630, partial [Aureobasidium melanogenum]
MQYLLLLFKAMAIRLANVSVAFYSSADCDQKNIVASTNDGCVGTLNPVGYEKNEYYFSVVQNYNDKREEDISISHVDPDLEVIRKRSPEEDQALMDANRNSTGSLNPLWDPLAVQRSGTYHGDVEEDVLGYNITVRWWQAAQGIFIGIPLEEWDDDIHVASDEWIPFGDTYPFDYTASQRHINVGMDPSADLDELAKRADFKGVCTGVATCSRILYASGTAGVTKAWGAIVNVGVSAMAKSSTAYSNVVDYLHAHPVRTGIVVSGTLGIGTGLALHPLGKAIFGKEAASCTDSVTTTVIETITYTVRDTANVAQARTSYDSSGNTLITVAGAWAPEKKLTKTSYCGADATAAKTKRSLMAYFQSLAMSQS